MEETSAPRLWVAGETGSGGRRDPRVRVAALGALCKRKVEHRLPACFLFWVPNLLVLLGGLCLGRMVRVLCAKLRPMTTREKAHKLLDELPESEIEPVVEFIVSRRERGNVDEWGDLDAWSDAASKDTMRMLDEEEAAVGFSWDENSPA